MSALSPSIPAGCSTPDATRTASSGGAGPATRPPAIPGSPSSAFSLLVPSQGPLAPLSRAAQSLASAAGGRTSFPIAAGSGDISATKGRGLTGGGPQQHGALNSGLDEALEPLDARIDSASRHAAQLAPPATHATPLLEGPLAAVAQTPSSSTPAGLIPASLGDLLPGLVRKVAWSGDARRGALRLELGSGSLSGASLLVQSDGGRVHVTLVAPSAPDVGSAVGSGGGVSRGDLEAWRERIAARLAARGIDVESVELGA